MFVKEYIKKKLNLKRVGKNFFALCLFHSEKTESMLINFKKNYFFCFGCKKYGNLTGILSFINLNIKKKYNKKKIFIKNKSLKINILKNFFLKRKIKLKTIKKFNIKYIKNIYSNRIIIPIFKNNKIVSYSSRSINNEKPKYLNSCNSFLYKKYKNFFYVKNIKSYLSKKFILIVEGYFDLIMMYQNKIKNVLCLMGSSINFYRLKKLNKLNKIIIFCLDGDKAGFNSLKILLKSLIKFNYNFNNYKFILFPFNLDPDEFIRIYKKFNFYKKIKKSKNILKLINFFILNKEFKLKKNLKKIFFFIKKNINLSLKFIIYKFFFFFNKIKNNINFLNLIELKILSYLILFPYSLYLNNKNNLRFLFLNFKKKDIFLILLKSVNKIKKKLFFNFFFILKKKYKKKIIDIILFNKNIKIYNLFNFKKNYNKFLTFKKKIFSLNIKNYIKFLIKTTVKYLIYIKNYEKNLYKYNKK